MEASRFQLFGPTHLTTLAVLILLTLIVVQRARALAPKQQERLLHYIACAALANGIVWRVILAARGDFSLETDLPVHVCSVSTFALGFALLLRNQFLYDVASYWILTGSTLALLIPDLEDPFPSFRFFALFLSHWIPLTGALVLLHVYGWKPSRTAPYRAFLVLLFWGVVVAWPVNSWLGTNYLFTEAHPKVDFFLVDWLPSPPFHLLLIGGFFFCLFLCLDHYLSRSVSTSSASLMANRV